MHNAGDYRQAPVRFLKPGYFLSEFLPRGFLARIRHPCRRWPKLAGPLGFAAVPKSFSVMLDSAG
jgi:hypothetical protein